MTALKKIGPFHFRYWLRKFLAFLLFSPNLKLICPFSLVVAVGTPGGILTALLLFCMATPFLILGYYFWSVVRAAYLEILNQVSKNNPILPTIFQDGGKKYQRM